MERILTLKNNYGETSLMKASERGSLDIVKYLIEHGADVNIKNNEGETALNLAERWELNEIIKALKETGAI